MTKRISIDKLRKEKSRLWNLSEFYSLKANYIQLVDEKIGNSEYGIALIREKEVLGDSKEAERLANMYFEQSQGISNVITEEEKNEQ